MYGVSRKRQTEEEMLAVSSVELFHASVSRSDYRLDFEAMLKPWGLRHFARLPAGRRFSCVALMFRHDRARDKMIGWRT